MDFIAQLVGFVALGVCLCSLQCKQYEKLLLLQVFSTLLFLTHFALLALSGIPAAWTAAASNAICLVRNLTFYFTRGKNSPFSPAVAFGLKAGVFALLLVVFGMVTWGGIASLFCIISMVLNTVAMAVQRPQYVRGITLTSIPFLLIYDIMTHSIAGMLNESLAAISAIVGLVRHRSVAQED